MAKITNNSTGPRTLNTKNGPITLAAGETRDDIEMSSEETASIKAVGLLDAPDEAKGTGSIADIQREIASASGGPIPDDTANDDTSLTREPPKSAKSDKTER